MAYLIGTDEAGYGPNLGPLVISASVWEVPDGVRADDLYRLLRSVISAAPRESGVLSRAGGKTNACEETIPADPNKDCRPVLLIADSKVVYQSGKGLAALERGVLVALALLGRRPTTWREVWDVLASDASNVLGTLLWHAGYDAPVPLDAESHEVHTLAQAVERGFQAAGVRLVGLRSRAIFEAEFNRLVEQHGSKGTLLSHATLELAAQSLAPLRSGPILVLCDKHGGRNAYRQLLSEWFPEWLVEVYREGREESLYRFGPAERRIEFRFRAKGETCLPTALASMASKYLRELSMRAMNAFWRARVPGLAPTAGYPADAKRFKAAIAAAQAALGIDDRAVWRSR
jgi:ribonuclease HII